jgi:hypothetical protein
MTAFSLLSLYWHAEAYYTASGLQNYRMFSTLGIIFESKFEMGGHGLGGQCACPYAYNLSRRFYPCTGKLAEITLA